MRSESQWWNAVRLNAEVVDNGTGQTGLTVTGTLRRMSDGLFLQSAGGWGASPSNLSLAAIDATNLPGCYSYEVATADLSYTAGNEGYVAKITETTFALLEYVHITTLTIRNDIRDLDISTPSTLTDGTLGESIARILTLRNHNVRIIYTAWATNNVPTAGDAYLYDTKAALLADTNPWTGAFAKYSFSANLSGSNVTDYISTRES
jgi:hypothetical protein